MKEETRAETARRVATHRMRCHIADADNAISRIEEIARRASIGISVNFAAEIANCHDAISELQEYIRKL